MCLFNYRGINLLSAVGQLCTSLHNSRLVAYFESNNILISMPSGCDGRMLILARRTPNHKIRPQIPKFDTATQDILKFHTAARHSIKIDMRHAIEATRDTIPLLSATNDTSLTDTRIDKCGVSFSFAGANFVKHCQGTMCLNHKLSKAMQIRIIQ